MKLVRLIIAAFVIGAAIIVAPQAAQAESYPSYVSGITMANLSNVDTTAYVYYVNGGTGPDAGVAQMVTDTILANGVKDYAAIPVTNFHGSVIVESGQPLAAISTLTGGGAARGSYVGVSSGATSITLPFLAKNHGGSKWNTFFAVQNIGSADTNVTVKYASCASSEAPVLVKSRASVIFDQHTTACLANGITSAVVTSDGQPLAAVVAQESTVVNSMLVSNGFSGASTLLAIPLVNSNNPNSTGWRTAITVMNTGTLDTDVTLTYVRTDGSSCTEKQTVPQKSSKVFAGRTLQIGPAAGVTTTCVAGTKTVGAAYIASAADNSASQPLVAVVNQDRGSMSSAYGSFDPAAGTPIVNMPLIMDNNGSGKWGTSFNIMNVGPATTYVKCTFTGSSYAPTSVSTGLTVNGVFEDLQRGKLAGPKLTNGTCKAYTDNTYTTVDTAAKIVGVVNERGTAGANDMMLTYEGINSVP
jgi:hypothetical protein